MIRPAYSLGNPSKDRQRFVGGIILISTPVWLKGLSNFESVAETTFEYGLLTSNNARLCQTAYGLFNSMRNKSLHVLFTLPSASTKIDIFA